MAKVAVKKGLKRGDAVVIKDRLYALTTKGGKLFSWDDLACIYTTRAEANAHKDADQVIVRLNDVTGTVV